MSKETNYIDMLRETGSDPKAVALLEEMASQAARAAAKGMELKILHGVTPHMEDNSIHYAFAASIADRITYGPDSMSRTGLKKLETCVVFYVAFFSIDLAGCKGQEVRNPLELEVLKGFVDIMETCDKILKHWIKSKQ